jgi:hypothetical protein
MGTNIMEAGQFCHFHCGSLVGFTWIHLDLLGLTWTYLDWEEGNLKLEIAGGVASFLALF